MEKEKTVNVLFAIILGGLMLSGAPALAQSSVPTGWQCDETWYVDGVCDCGCGVIDRDCSPGLFDVCERHGCDEGQVPWEHRPTSCMRSACGDGWRDEALGELCDDGEALDSGGCDSVCSAVNVGWTCGDRAAGCAPERRDPPLDMDVEVDMAVELDMAVIPDVNPSVDARTETETQTDASGPISYPFEEPADGEASGCKSDQNQAPVNWSLAALVGVVLIGRRMGRKAS